MYPHPVGSAAAALAWVRQQTGPCPLILLNLPQTVTEAVALATHLRLACPTPEVAVLMLVSLTSRRELSSVPPPDRTAFLVKPVRPALLHTALVSLVRGEPITRRCVFEHEGFDIQTGQRFPLRILLAEDNITNQKVALRMLEKMGYRADVAATGYEVLEAMRRCPYDVVLMDVQMPGMDGIEATRCIRDTWPAEQQPSIIALTAHAMDSDRQRCLEAGMDDYLGKPVGAGELSAKLMQVRTKRRQAPTAEQVGRASIAHGQGGTEMR